MLSAGMKGRGRDDQNRRVDEKREHQGHARVNGRELDRLSFAGRVLLVVARLHTGGRKIKIRRHPGGAEISDRYERQVAMANFCRVGKKPPQPRLNPGLEKNDLKKKATADGQDE